MATVSFSTDAINYSVTYSFTQSTGIFEITSVTATTKSGMQGWVTSWIEGPEYIFYAVPGTSYLAESDADSSNSSEVHSWISDKNGDFIYYKGNNIYDKYLSGSSGGSKTWDPNIKLDFSNSTATTARVMIGSVVVHDGTTGLGGAFAGHISTALTLNLYKAPTGHTVSVTSSAVRSITATHNWTFGSVDNESDYDTRSITVESNSDDTPTYSKTQTVAKGKSYTFADDEKMQPNRLYKITSKIDDGTSNTGHSDEKTTYRRTNVGATTGLTVSSDTSSSSIKIKASSNNVNFQKNGKYVLDYKYNGETVASGTYAEFTKLTPNLKYKVVAVAINNNPDYDQAKSTSAERTYYVWTDPSTPSSVSATRTTTSIQLQASSNNNTDNLRYVYKLDGTEKYNGTSSVTYSSLTPNTNYSFTAKAVNTSSGGSTEYNNGQSSSSYSSSAWTKPATPTGTSTLSSTTTSITVKATSANGTSNLQYVYKIGSTTKTVAYNESATFTGLSPNTKYSISISAKNSSTGETSSATSVDRWTYPEISSLTLALASGKEHDQINATATPTTSNSKDEYQFTIGSTNKDYQTGRTYSFTGLTENKSYTISVKMKNTTSGLVSASVSESITTWYDPISNLSVVLTNQWYWRLGIKPSFTYNGTITKCEYSITTSGTSYTENSKKDTSGYIKGSTTGGASGNLTYNTNHICKIRLTDNHGRSVTTNPNYEATATYKTLDERPLYVDGSLKEVKVIKSDGTKVYITPDLLTVIKSDGTKVNMNDIINPDRISTK